MYVYLNCSFRSGSILLSFCDHEIIYWITKFVTYIPAFYVTVLQYVIFLWTDELLNLSSIYLLLQSTNFFSISQVQPVIWYENEPPGVITTLLAKDNDSIENGPPFTFAINETRGPGVDLRAKFSIDG